MNYDKRIEKEISSISLEDVYRYLLEQGWEKHSHPNLKVARFLGPKDNKGHRIEILLPNNRNYSDYLTRIRDALNVLTFVANKDLSDLTKDISLISHDVFQIRVLDIGPSNTIPLTVAADDVTALRNLFIYSACSEQRNLPYFEKPLMIGLYHADQCQFGHTFEGSFGFTINSPIITDYSQLALFGEHETKPFERRVMERIMRGLDLVEQSVAQEKGDIVVENFDVGLNSRMCESLLEISQSKSKEVDFYISWSPKFTVPDDLKHKNNWRLNKASYEILEYAADELKKVEPHQATIIGPIVTLHSTKNPMSDEDFIRHAIVKYEYDRKVINVKLELDRSEYSIAYEAHGKGLPIKVTGRLYRRGNTWKMIDVEDVRMLLR